MAERERSEQKFWSRRVVKGLGALTAAAVAGSVYGGLTVRRNDRDTQAAQSIATELVPGRHTCRITDAHHEASDVGGPVLAVTVALSERTPHDRRDSELDRTGVDVTFQDAGAPRAGLRLLRLDPGETEQSPYEHKASSQPDNHVASATFQEPLWRVDMNNHWYRVQYQDAVRATVRGLLVRDRDYVGIAELSKPLDCGDLKYNSRTDTMQILPPVG